MSLSNMMPGDNSGADGPSCGEELHVYQDFLKVVERFRKWKRENEGDIEAHSIRPEVDEVDDSLDAVSTVLLNWRP